MRLIDADGLKTQMAWFDTNEFQCVDSVLNSVLREINNAPTIDLKSIALQELLHIPLFKVKRPEDTVIVAIMACRSDGMYHFVNLTKGHICKCGFQTIKDAIDDMISFKYKGKIVEWIPLKTCSREGI